MVHDSLIYRSEFHPHPPLQVIDFLKNDLKVSQKYVTMVTGGGAEHLARIWLRHVHLLCLVEPDRDYFEFIKSQLGKDEQLWVANAPLSKIPVDDDSIDCLVSLGPQSILADDMRLEFRRILRLNSYLVQITHQINNREERTFGWAFCQFFKQYSESEHEYEQLPTEENLTQTFKDGYEHKVFANQVRLSWDGVQGYYLASKGAITTEDPKFKWALKALRILFEQYQVDGEVHIDYDTQIYYGLYNMNVPAISLRKSLFFNILRPFAFGFYVLVKLNMYFWRSLLGKRS